jgi:ubiquinol-cytochrome c reductase cytochrome c1 subunit
MKLNLLLAFVMALPLGLLGIAFAEENPAEPKRPYAQEWSWEGPFGKFDRQQLRRGYQVYKELCSACHAMHLVTFRNLSQPGGPELSHARVKTIAASFKFPAIDDKGEAAERPGTPADSFPSPFSNDNAARAANNNALPPDLSVIIKAREGGADYVYALLTGFSEPPPEMQKNMLPDLNYNPYFPGRQIAMAGVLAVDGQITYPAGSPPATVSQMAKDVVAFLTWASEPQMEERKQLGLKVMMFVMVLSVLLYFAYRHVWRDVAH